MAIHTAMCRYDRSDRYGPYEPDDLRTWLADWDPEAFDREHVARWFDVPR